MKEKPDLSADDVAFLAGMFILAPIVVVSIGFVLAPVLLKIHHFLLSLF